MKEMQNFLFHTLLVLFVVGSAAELAAPRRSLLTALLSPLAVVLVFYSLSTPLPFFVGAAFLLTLLRPRKPALRLLSAVSLALLPAFVTGSPWVFLFSLASVLTITANSSSSLLPAGFCYAALFLPALNSLSHRQKEVLVLTSFLAHHLLPLATLLLPLPVLLGTLTPSRPERYPHVGGRVLLSFAVLTSLLVLHLSSFNYFLYPSSKIFDPTTVESPSLKNYCLKCHSFNGINPLLPKLKSLSPEEALEEVSRHPLMPEIHTSTEGRRRLLEELTRTEGGSRR